GSPSSSLSEAVAIDKLFKHYEHKIDVVALKPFIGHTLGASGINEIVLLCQCIKNGFVPKTFGFNQSYNDVAFDVLTKNKNADSATILFNSIGFGGSNHSIILSNKSS
ncbi:MAG: 3-oxoacyl-[acyl-carrier-protein] synthase II, partial [Rickettsiales bacterium]